ncbi:unnamed protein product [Cylindrotheca closterium]|uniref:Uncharacterized protein n=1 Tax=Cylindrotheca closterium TaxID=2856 RepID=A0AAD2FS70_9STRA|nr:unnamed protein product [Cylindrotheca closterium]
MKVFTMISWVAIVCNPVNALINARLSMSLKPHDAPLQAIPVQTVSLESLENHEDEGSYMAESIRKWLDDEWIPQDVHIKMAESAKKSYIACRESGQDDVMDILMAISNDLESNWQEYDADSFVNAWDIGNYASDYLINRSGNEGCECSAKIY